VEPRGGAWHCNRRKLPSCFSEHKLRQLFCLSLFRGGVLCLAQPTGKSN
jgi:hypothetical protein